MEKVRKHIIFSGRVQGVGFRYTACYLARPLGLTGWVKNLWDGDVEMEVQGDPAAADFCPRLWVMASVGGSMRNSSSTSPKGCAQQL